MDSNVAGENFTALELRAFRVARIICRVCSRQLRRPCTRSCVKSDPTSCVSTRTSSRLSARPWKPTKAADGHRAGQTVGRARRAGWSRPSVNSANASAGSAPGLPSRFYTRRKVFIAVLGSTCMPSTSLQPTAIYEVPWYHQRLDEGDTRAPWAIEKSAAGSTTGSQNRGA